MRKPWVTTLATGLHVGRIPFMPGTFGTLVGIPVALLLTLGGPYFYMGAAIALVLGASYIAELYEQGTPDHDPSEVVVDEIAGYVIAATWLPMTWQAYLAAFLTFRFFDILKPWPISYIDRKIEGGLGTVLDDVAAGIVSNIVLQVVYTKTDWLGVKLYVTS